MPKATAKRANYVVKSIRHSTAGQSREVTIPFYTVLWSSTSHVESYVHFWEPQFKNITLLECVRSSGGQNDKECRGQDLRC